MHFCDISVPVVRCRERGDSTGAHVIQDELCVSEPQRDQCKVSADTGGGERGLTSDLQVCYGMCIHSLAGFRCGCSPRLVCGFFFLSRVKPLVSPPHAVKTGMTQFYLLIY